MNNNKSRLYPEDQKRVERFLHEGINEVERESFKPMRLMLWLTVLIVILGVLSQVVGFFVVPS